MSLVTGTGVLALWRTAARAAQRHGASASRLDAWRGRLPHAAAAESFKPYAG